MKLKKPNWKKVARVAGRVAEVAGAVVGAKSDIVGGMIEAGGKKVQQMAKEKKKPKQSKKPGVPARAAFDENLTHYKAEIPQLFWFNALLIASNGTDSRVGSLTANWERFFEWKRIEREDEPRRVSLEVMIRGTFANIRLRNQLLDGVERIRAIPAVIVQGRYDVVCPMATAWELHRRWPEADFRVVGDAGHSAYEPGITAELVAATDRFLAVGVI